MCIHPLAHAKLAIRLAARRPAFLCRLAASRYKLYKVGRQSHATLVGICLPLAAPWCNLYATSCILLQFVRNQRHPGTICTQLAAPWYNLYATGGTLVQFVRDLRHPGTICTQLAESWYNLYATGGNLVQFECDWRHPGTICTRLAASCYNLYATCGTLVQYVRDWRHLGTICIRLAAPWSAISGLLLPLEIDWLQDVHNYCSSLCIWEYVS